MSSPETTMQFEYDPERLIEEVKKRPGIWNYDDINYRTMSARIELWNEVVSELLEPNVKVTKAETRELVLQLQKKWKSIKDAFHKYVHNPTRSRRPYIYYKHLQFLLKNDPDYPAMGTTAGGSDESEDTPIVKKKKVWKAKHKKPLEIIKCEGQTSEEEEEEDNNSHYVDVPFNNDECENVTATTNKSIKTVDDFAFANVDSRSIDSDDCDKMFLMSLLPHLKSIPEDQRLNAKMELLKVLRNANMGCNSSGNFMV